MKKNKRRAKKQSIPPMYTSAVDVYLCRKGKQKGRWRARIKASNGKVLMETSEAYVRLRDLRNCLELCKTLIKWP